ncbi:Globoside alpha-1,3-N-acetylgalactosaminyltransferase 1 [Bagarius yarrelli]|uniref:Globoside alpha-1,3-N-acetylgalactosaminyltransferase 1 n=1 Tax=Bagarius yarrelli TaxID=175774 RepID=A0A556V1M3_BAGYA|nr:Globoside alpha-1,3-N-acetylgalactosaminyltransferase 1 [Bagarius yarrelli]
METGRLENGMPCHNQKQAITSERRELEHAAKQVRFAGKSSSCSSTSADTARGGGRGGKGGGDAAAADGQDINSNCDIAKQIGPQLKLLPLNDQIRELQTIIRDKSTSRGDFVFSADRLAMEQGLRDCCRSIRIGKILIQSDEETQKAKVFYAKFPPDISRRKVLLMYPILNVSTTSRWLAPIVWENTFDQTVIDAIYKPQNITVATTVFAVGRYTRFLKDLLESAEQHFLVGYRVHYYLFTDLPDQVPVVKLGDGRKLTVIKTESSNRWQEISSRRMERIEKLIEEKLLHKVDYMFSLDVDSKFYAHWGAESLGDLVGVVHAWFFGLTRPQFTYERRPKSQAYIPYDEGDYYYGGAVFGGRPEKVLKLVQTCRRNLDIDRANQIEALWQEESHLNKYFLYNKPTKLLSPEYLWDDTKQRPSFMKVVRFTQVVKNYAEIRPNP